MIIQERHHSVAHGARGMTLNHLRQRGTCIVNTNAIARHFINKAPFTYCRVDMFGPLIIKERRSELKCYGALFTCFSSCVVHIEVTNSLNAYSFILAHRRFIARTGTVHSVWSDNGTNFVADRNELQQASQEMKHDNIKSFLQKNETNWILWHSNTPGASHMGGVIEYQIRSAITILEG